jgi:DNA-binding CsgD family transcriptional regulator
MNSPMQLPWIKINDFLLDIGSERDPKEFCIASMNKISSLIPYDTGVLYLLQENGSEYEHALVEVEPYWSEAYMNYYSKLDSERFSFNNAGVGEVDWNDFNNTEYVTDFIKPQGYDHSATLKFFSADFSLTGALALNRSGHAGFTETEKNILRVIRPHLSNLHTNLFIKSTASIGSKAIDSFHDGQKHLSKRESEIIELLCKGMNPGKIGGRLFISPRTVSKHIENIHRKLGVSSMQELLVKLFNSKAI